MHQIRFRLGKLTAHPDPLASFGGYFAAGEGLGWGRGGGRGSGGREREGPQVTVEPGPLRALLRHWVSQRCGKKRDLASPQKL